MVAERRRTPRLAATATGVTSLRIRPGHPAAIVDLSRQGACLETSRRLLPGGRVDLSLEERAQTIAIRASVLRSVVVHVAADGLRYRVAVRFIAELPAEVVAGGGNVNSES